MESPRGDVDWDTTREILRAIQEINPGFTTDNCLIGGSAAWFYKSLLKTEGDKDFPCPEYTEEEHAIWYSRDVDFIGTSRRDLPDQLQTNPEGDPPIVKINGVWVDTPNEGVFLTKELALKTAVEVENPNAGAFYKIASPILLYREKKELGKMGNEGERPQDHLHLRTLRTAAKLILCKLAEDPNLNQKQAALLFKLLKEAQEIAPEILNDRKLLNRLRSQLPAFLSNQKTKAIYHLLNNQILPFQGPSPEEQKTAPAAAPTFMQRVAELRTRKGPVQKSNPTSERLRQAAQRSQSTPEKGRVKTL